MVFWPSFVTPVFCIDLLQGRHAQLVKLKTILLDTSFAKDGYGRQFLPWPIELFRPQKEVTLTRALGAEFCQPLSGKDFSPASPYSETNKIACHILDGRHGQPCCGVAAWTAWTIKEGCHVNLHGLHKGSGKVRFEEHQNKPGAFKTCGIRKLVNSLLFSIAIPHPPLLAAFTQHTPQKVAAWYNKSASSPTSTKVTWPL